MLLVLSIFLIRPLYFSGHHNQNSSGACVLGSPSKLRKINSTWLALFKFLSTFLLLLLLDGKMSHLFTGSLFTCNLITAVLCKFRILVPCLSVAIKAFYIQSSFSSFITKSLYFYKSRKSFANIKGNTVSHNIWWSWLWAEIPQTMLVGAVQDSTRGTHRACHMSRVSELFFLNCHLHMLYKDIHI